MIQKALLEEGGADEIEAVLAHPQDRRLQLNPPSAVEHVRQRDRPDFLGHPVSRQPVKKRVCVRSLHQNLGEGRDIHNPDPLADRVDLTGNQIVHDRAPE